VSSRGGSRRFVLCRRVYALIVASGLVRNSGPIEARGGLFAGRPGVRGCYECAANLDFALPCAGRGRGVSGVYMFLPDLRGALPHVTKASPPRCRRLCDVDHAPASSASRGVERQRHLAQSGCGSILQMEWGRDFTEHSARARGACSGSLGCWARTAVESR